MKRLTPDRFYNEEEGEQHLEERRQVRLEWEQMKAEEKRLEDSMYEPRDREQFIHKNEANSEKD